jgi:hypothetical protein
MLAVRIAQASAEKQAMEGGIASGKDEWAWLPQVIPAVTDTPLIRRGASPPFSHSHTLRKETAMSPPEKTKSLEMRVVELENRLQNLQPEPASFSPEDVKAYDRVSSALRIYKCINECICGPCNCDIGWITHSLVNYARFAQVAGVLSKEVVAQLTQEVAQNVGRPG